MDIDIGITLLVIGIALLPFGIIYTKETWEEYRKQGLTRKKKALNLILEVLDMFTFTSGSSILLLFISLLCIIFGSTLIVLFLQGVIPL